MGLVYNGVEYTLSCNKCGRALKYHHGNANVMRDIARRHNWYRIRGTEKDFCPNCKGEHEFQEHR